MTTAPEVKPIKRKQKGSKKYYRGPLDKVVAESKITAKKIAAKMGITYDRMVALRRVKELNPADLALCKLAVKELQEGNSLTLQQLIFEPDNNSSQRADYGDDGVNHAAWDEINREKIILRELAEKAGIHRYIPPEEKLARAAYLLGMSSVFLSTTKEAMGELGIPISKAAHESLAKLMNGIEELFYKDK